MRAQGSERLNYLLSYSWWIAEPGYKTSSLRMGLQNDPIWIMGLKSNVQNHYPPFFIALWNSDSCEITYPNTW